MFYIVLIVFVILGVILKFLNRLSTKSLNGRHVVVTGGSSGIGKAFAILAAKQGAHVSILARNADKLEAAQKEIRENATDQQTITKVSVDVADKSKIEKSVAELEETVGPIYMLVNCAGMAICGKLEDIEQSDVTHMINVNLLGTIYAVQAVLPRFKQRHEGIIVITASVVALMGMYGYSVYSACKFALRGLAETVYMESRPYKVSVTLALPPDTDTPGFENENKTKPKETHLLSESGGLHAPEKVAQQILSDALKGHFFSYVGFESFILTSLCVGMSPFHSVVDVMVQSVILGPLRLIAAFYVKHFERIVDKCFREQTEHRHQD